MSINLDDLLKNMLEAGQQTFGEGWDDVKSYAPVEFKKMAVQIKDIAENVARYKLDPQTGYSEETGHLLFKMQQNACESVIAAMTKLTLLAVQNAINAMLKVLRDSLGGAVRGII